MVPSGQLGSKQKTNTYPIVLLFTATLSSQHMYAALQLMLSLCPRVCMPWFCNRVYTIIANSVQVCNYSAGITTIRQGISNKIYDFKLSTTWGNEQEKC